MSLIINLSDTAANAAASGISALFNGGSIQIYSGTQPANANTAVGGGNTLLATLTLPNPACGAPAAGILTFNTIAAVTAVANGTATFARFLQSNGTTVICDAPIGVTNNAINLNSTAIVSGVTVAVTSLTLQVQET